MIIYRLENESGAGPFGLRSDIDRIKYETKEFPSPNEEGLEVIPDKHYCAVMSIELFNHWFSDVLDQLMDFYFCEIEVDAKDLQIGNKQCVFVKSRSTYLKKIPIKEMIQDEE